MLPSLTEGNNMLAKITDPVYFLFTVIYNFFIWKDLTAPEKLKKTPLTPPTLSNSTA